MACLWGYTGQRPSDDVPETWHARLPQSMQSYSYGPAQFDHPFKVYGVCIYGVPRTMQTRTNANVS